MTRWLVSIAAALLGGCTAMTTVPANERAVINGALAVKPTQTWSRIASFDVYGANNLDVWTVDGHLLERLCFVAGLGDNESVHKTLPNGTPEPVFRSTMTPNDVMELFEGIMSRGSPVMLQTSGLRPARFAGVPGFRFDFRFVGQSDEVERQGIAVGAIHKGKLYLVYYHGARIHFFGKNLPEVERIIASATIL